MFFYFLIDYLPIKLCYFAVPSAKRLSRNDIRTTEKNALLSRLLGHHNNEPRLNISPRNIVQPLLTKSYFESLSDEFLQQMFMNMSPVERVLKSRGD